MHDARPYKIHKFGTDDALAKLPSSRQQEYLLCYLTELEAVSVLEEPNYFDRDYLAEFSAFYSISSRGYSNLCRRLHFFKIKITRDQIRRAAGGSKSCWSRLQEAYLGFVVLRPIPSAQLGRTVLKWYADDGNLSTPRIKTPSRDYYVHFAGLEFKVEGLAWQQQDSAVGACATVGLWSMLHSSAFDDHHAIPTTAEITQAAHKRASLGARIFPSGGLTIYQICEAIKEQNLAPVPMDGDITLDGQVQGFGKERFASSCAAFLRSGYPVLIIGHLGDLGQHAICAVGFRSCPSDIGNSLIEPQDSRIQFLYIHDDNLGPSVRFSIKEEQLKDKKSGNIFNRVVLRTDAPPPRQPRPVESCPTDNYDNFVPIRILVAVHNDLRTSPDQLHKAGLYQADRLSQLLSRVAKLSGTQTDQLIISTRFIKLAQFLGIELGSTLAAKGKERILAKVRLMLCEKVAPMSLHIGLVRIGKKDSSPVLDIIYDTTDSDNNHPVYATIAYDPFISKLIELLIKSGEGKYGELVQAF